MADYSDYKECTDCVHYELCLHQEKFLIEYNRKDLIRRYGFGLSEPEICCNFKDRSRFVELPCSTSEDLFAVENSGEIVQDKVETIVSIGYDEDFSLSKIDCYSGKTYNVSDIGKTIFFTHEGAEAALKEREEND